MLVGGHREVSGPDTRSIVYPPAVGAVHTAKKEAVVGAFIHITSSRQGQGGIGYISMLGAVGGTAIPPATDHPSAGNMIARNDGSMDGLNGKK